MAITDDSGRLGSGNGARGDRTGASKTFPKIVDIVGEIALATNALLRRVFL